MEFLRDYVNEGNLIKDEIYKAFKTSIICSICKDLILEPSMCINCQLVCCRKCFDDWSSMHSKCPNRCKNPIYKKSLAITELLSKLKFRCYKCDNVIKYDEMKRHCLLSCKPKFCLEKIHEYKIDDSLYAINSK